MTDKLPYQSTTAFPPNALAQAADARMAEIIASTPGAFVNPIGRPGSAYPRRVNQLVPTSTGGNAPYDEVFPVLDPSGKILWTGPVNEDGTGGSGDIVSGLGPVETLMVDVVLGGTRANLIDYNPPDETIANRPIPDGPLSVAPPELLPAPGHTYATDDPRYVAPATPTPAPVASTPAPVVQPVVVTVSADPTPTVVTTAPTAPSVPSGPAILVPHTAPTVHESLLQGLEAHLATYLADLAPAGRAAAAEAKALIAKLRSVCAAAASAVETEAKKVL
jgi:hypothetical protein